MAAADVFVDTAGFLALWDAADEHHARAVKLQDELARRNRRFLTTEYVVDETVTLLARSDPASVDRLMDLYQKYRAVAASWKP